MNYLKNSKEGIEQAGNHLRGKKVLGSKVTKITVEPVPRYSSKQIKYIRNKLNISQVLGVHRRTVECWESGTSKPSATAQRLLKILEDDPTMVEKYYKVEVQEAI